MAKRIWIAADEYSDSLRSAFTIRCEECGGDMEKTEPTKTERKEFGCDFDKRDSATGSGCCVGVFVCEGCGKRLAMRLSAPECDW